IIISVTGTSNLREMGGLMKTHASLGWMYLIAVFGLVGIPPLSGFIGKLLIVQGGFEAGNIWTTIIILISSIIVLLSAMRIFVYAFWRVTVALAETKKSSYRKEMIPAVLLVVISIVYGIGDESLIPYMENASDLLLNPSIYIDAVLKEYMQMAFQILLNFSIAVVWMLLNTSFKASTFIIGYLIGMIAIVIMRRYFKDKLYLYRIW